MDYKHDCLMIMMKTMPMLTIRLCSLTNQVSSAIANEMYFSFPFFFFEQEMLFLHRQNAFYIIVERVGVIILVQNFFGN